MTRGLSYAEAARESHRSLSTVRSLLYTAYGRLGVSRISQALAVCVQVGWLDPVPEEGAPVYLADRRVTWAQRLINRLLLALAAAITVFALAAPVSSASAFTWPAGWSGFGTAGVGAGGQAGSFGCGVNAPDANGANGGSAAQACGSVLEYVGPAIGSVSSAVGPTIIGSTVLAPLTVSAGPVAS